ncbi:hypothetical protein [Vreelandella hamiltonii]|uniref:Uncharacterized protein n=1 Tax=Halomonas johnsoniae TaxID=502832 RepID=A0ABQ2WC36_9GAMM|nr:hypothetical protein [Halomonas johnsoniae]GGW45081.1 hypothetical protein GCM10007158_02100 [Halomonas johnsoniae]
MLNINYSGNNYSNINADQAQELGIPETIIKEAVFQKVSRDIDNAAGNARAAFVSPGSYIDQEYLLAKEEAQAWLDNGKNANAIPSSVSDHMAMFEVGAEAAATEIVATAEAWETALREIRQLRLGGKAAVRQAETIEAAEAAAKEAIEQLNRYRPPEG